MKLSEAERVFHEALSIASPEERSTFLSSACGGDDALREKVKRLLQAHEESPDFLAAEPGDRTGQAGDLEQPGAMIGRYQLLEKIGEGGFGVVYMAEQTEPVKRRVALKIIKLGMDTRQVIARFEAERQALALMDHPHIAKVLDAGATATGRPYFVMELVRGVAITRFCEENRLTIKERLELFIPVCRAIQHAHQKGVIHRDIKPSNVLVTFNDGVPHPMVIDFGVAKAMDQRLTEKTLYTRFAQMIGTPAYMSPEQALMSKQDVDTRTDVYSLGILLYELLTGTTPFPEQRLREAGYVEIQRILNQEDPVRPSTAFSRLNGLSRTVASNRHCEPAALLKLIKGDLDWIVLKAIEKDRTRRYETANELATDLKRHLDNEPVVARPPSRLYEFRKSVQRHKVGFAAAAAIIVVLFAGVLVSTWQAVRATRAQREALAAQADEAKQKAVAQQALFNWIVGQARAARLARHSGYRDRVFGLLEKAKALAVAQTNMTVLRDEAVACLGDFIGLAKTFTFPTNVINAALAPSGDLAAVSFPDGTIRLLKMPSGKHVARLVGTNGAFYQVCFNATGDQLFALARLGGPSFYHWTRDADGRWRETANGAVQGDDLLLKGRTNGFAPAIKTWVRKSDDPSVGGLYSYYSYRINLRLFNLETGAFVPGYDVTCFVTNGWRWYGFSAAKGPGGGVFAVETLDTQNTNSSVTISLYDWKSRQRINQLHFPEVRTLRLSPDGKYLACFSDVSGAIYTVPGLTRIGRFTGDFSTQSGDFFYVTFARNKVAMRFDQSGQPGRIRLRNLETRKDIALLDEPEKTYPVAFASDGNSLLTVDFEWRRDLNGYGLTLYRPATPEKLDLPPHAAAVPGIAFSPDGTRLASVGKDRVIRVCDASTGRILWQTNDLPGPGQCLGYSPDGRWLATGDFDTEQVWVWDARTGKRLLQLGDSNPESIWSAQFSPDGRYLATVGSKVKVYRIQRKPTADGNGRLVATLIKRLPFYSRNLMFAPDGRFLTFDTTNKQNNLHLFAWDFATSSQPRDTGFQVPSAHQTESFMRDGRYLLGLDSMGKITTLKMPGGKRISSFQIRKPNEDSIDAISLSPDGSRLAMVSTSNLAVEIWNPKTGQRLYSLPEAPGTIYWLAWSPDSRRLAVARANGNITIWNLDTVGQILTKLELKP